MNQISSQIIKRQNWDIFESYLLKCGYSFPNTLQIIANIFSTYNHHKYELNLEAIKRFCNNLIKVHARSDHHGEVAWLLWICKELELEIKDELIEEIQQMNSSVCSLIALDLYHSEIINKNFPTDYLNKFSNKDSLYNSDWLMAYEAGKNKWLTSEDITYIIEDNYFKELHQYDISFYNRNVKCNPIFEFKDESQFSLFDSDDDINRYFEFDQIDEEYFDKLEFEYVSEVEILF